jgi:hypothetical protein
LVEDNGNFWREICSIATLSTISTTWITLGLNLGIHGDMPGTSYLSYEKVSLCIYIQGRRLAASWNL